MTNEALRKDSYVLCRDGNMWRATRLDFVNLMESPAGFGPSYSEAIENLHRAEYDAAGCAGCGGPLNPSGECWRCMTDPVAPFDTFVDASSLEGPPEEDIYFEYVTPFGQQFWLRPTGNSMEKKVR